MKLCKVVAVLLLALGGTEAQEDRERAAVLLERLAAAARDDLRRPGACPWDWRAKAADLGHDPARLFAFVRDSIAFEPYEGILRGSTGVLMGRSGNALEKALLLQDMLRVGGHQTRLAAGTLSREIAERLVRSFLERDPLVGVLGEEAASPQASSELLARLGFPPDALKDWNRTVGEEARARREELESLVRREGRFLSDGVSAAGVKLGSSENMGDSVRSAVAAGHVWVQRFDRSSQRWVDEDPTIPDAKPGTVYADGSRELPVVDPRLVHRLTVRLKLKRTVGGKPEEVRLLEVPIETRDSAVTPIRFAIVPGDHKLPAPDELLRMAPDKAREVFASVGRFQAILSVGGKQHASLVFERNGNTLKPVAGRLQEMIRDFGEDFLEEKPKPKLERLWMELEFTGPAGSRTQERVLLDDAPLRKPDLLTEWSFFLQTQPLPNSHLHYAATRQFLRSIPLILSALRGKEVRAADAPANDLSLASSFALERQAELGGMLRALPREARPAVFWAEPSLFISKRNLRLRDGGKDGWTCNCLDIVRDDLRFVQPGAEMKRTPEFAVLFGVRETCLEELAVAPCPKTKRREGTVSFFALRRMEGRGGLAVVPTRKLEGASVPAYTREWILKSEPERVLALLPAGWSDQEKDFCWWSLDPATGYCLGRSWDGEGHASDENSYLYANSIEQFVFFSYGLLLCGMGVALGNGVVQTACCALLSYVEYIYIANIYWNLFFFVYGNVTLPITPADPCWLLLKALRWL